jgi:hypothetical protein
VFNTDGGRFGTAIQEAADQAHFDITQPGWYRVDFAIGTADVSLPPGAFQAKVNGVPIDPPTGTILSATQSATFEICKVFAAGCAGTSAGSGVLTIDNVSSFAIEASFGSWAYVTIVQLNTTPSS